MLLMLLLIVVKLSVTTSIVGLLLRCHLTPFTMIDATIAIAHSDIQFLVTIAVIIIRHLLSDNSVKSPPCRHHASRVQQCVYANIYLPLFL